MPGYSGTPLAKKLGIKDGFRIALMHVPADVMAELRNAFDKCQTAKPARGDLDFVFLFVESRAVLERELMTAAKALAPAGMLWIAWPKKSSRVSTDVDENIVRESGLGAGLVDIKICAVTEVWSGLKFVIPVRDRPKKK
jgi:hypothetical protein